MDMSCNPEPQPVCYSELQHHLTCKLFFWLSSISAVLRSRPAVTGTVVTGADMRNIGYDPSPSCPAKSSFYNQLGR
jgi:hypothetical protein